MPLYTIIILAIVQGLSEPLPVSSSGHLLLTHTLMGNGGVNACWEANRALDVAMHIGTLFSVLVYFRKDVFAVLSGIGNRHSQGFQMAWHVALASVPVLSVGFLLQIYKPSFLCLLEVMAWMLLIFGIVLGLVDKYCKSEKTVEQMTWKNALFVGIAQSLALVPGTSRSGITMTAARFMGFKRTEAARFSLLLAIVGIAAAGGLTALEMVVEKDYNLGYDALIAVFVAFFTGYAAIAVMMKWLQKASFMPFAVYRVILGVGLLVAIYSGWM